MKNELGKKLSRVIKVFAILEEEYEEQPIFSSIKEIAHHLKRKLPDMVDEETEGFVEFLDLKARMEVLSYFLDIMDELGMQDTEEYGFLEKSLRNLEERYDSLKVKYESKLMLWGFEQL